ncbi:hypothetical protein KFL_007020020 [Klebsormidium nitens]|uniref:Uncharacterized protein n=1 Tax=Klebsormidium nitens TaxID=105231 RepID=A0A1Y1IJ57_KLENI|nr:hypothetical protein KFL_007020020 [Klebsormidium nitens]|eukprot:GAQ90915.1 hypothetical protein KFL_007020020 [Klebsormidium nitens]
MTCSMTCLMRRSQLCSLAFPGITLRCGIVFPGSACGECEQNLYQSAWDQSLGEALAGSVQIGKWGWGKQSLDGLVAAPDKHREQVFVSTCSQPVRVSVQRAQPLAKLSKCWLCNRKLHDSKSVLGSTCRQHILRMLRALELKKETFDDLRALMHTDPAEFKKVFADKGYDATLKELKAEVRDALREGTGENEYEEPALQTDMGDDDDFIDDADLSGEDAVDSEAREEDDSDDSDDEVSVRNCPCSCQSPLCSTLDADLAYVAVILHLFSWRSLCWMQEDDEGDDGKFRVHYTGSLPPREKRARNGGRRLSYVEVDSASDNELVSEEDK